MEIVYPIYTQDNEKHTPFGRTYPSGAKEATLCGTCHYGRSKAFNYLCCVVIRKCHHYSSSKQELHDLIDQ